jgi:hypothetical protein
MKTFKQTRDVLINSQDFHQRSSTLYAGLATRASNPRAKLLLEFMSNHSQQLKDNLKNYSDTAPNNILDTWFQYTPEENNAHYFDAIKDSDDLSVDQATELGITLHHYQEMIFKELGEEVSREEIKAVFENMQQQERHEKESLVRSAMLIYDF